MKWNRMELWNNRIQGVNNGFGIEYIKIKHFKKLVECVGKCYELNNMRLVKEQMSLYIETKKNKKKRSV